MQVKNAIYQGFRATRISWITETIYLLLFGLVVGVILLPFSFLVAIASVDLPAEVTDPLELGWFFWGSVALLVFVADLFTLMIIGMVQKIGVDKNNGISHSFESLVQYPFRNGRFTSFLLLSLITSVIGGVLGIIVYLLDNWLNIYSNNILYDDWILGIAEVIVLLILTPPILIATYSIIRDDSRLNAFVAGWKNYLNKFSDFSVMHLLALIPMAVIIALITFTGIAISWFGDGEQTMELFYILTLSFVIIVISLLLVFIGLPFYLLTVANGYEENNKTIA